MQVTSLLSQHEHEHGPECGCGHDHEHSVVHLWQAVVGVVCVLNAFIVDWLFESGTTLASASAMIGALILIYPIVVPAIAFVLSLFLMPETNKMKIWEPEPARA